MHDSSSRKRIGRLGAWALCAGSALVAVRPAAAQILIPSDAQRTKDRIEAGARDMVECAGDEDTGRRRIRLVASAGGAVGIGLRERTPQSDRRIPDASQVRLHLTTTRPCGGWDVWVDGFFSVRGELGERAEGAWLFPLGVKVGAVSLYAGASTVNSPTATRELALSRETWGGATYVTPDLYEAIFTRVFGLEHRFAIALLASLQGDVTFDGALRRQRDQQVIPHYSLALPLPVGRPAWFRGLLLTWEDAVNYRAGRDLRRRDIAAEIDPRKGQVKVLLRFGDQRLPGERNAKQATLQVTLPLWGR